MDETNTSPVSAIMNTADTGTVTSDQTYYFPPNKNNFSRPFIILSWILPVAAFILLEVFLQHDIGLGATLFVLAFAALCAVAAKKLNGRLDTCSAILLVIIAALSPVFYITENSLTRILTVILIIAMVRYWTLYTFRRCDEFLSESFPIDYVKSVLLPYASFFSMFSAQGRSFGKSKRGKWLLYLVVGILIAIVPTVLVTALLMDADGAFSNMMDSLNDYFSDTFGEHILILIFSIPVAMYLFGMFYSSAENKAPRFLTEKSKKTFFDSVGVAPSVGICAVLVPLCIVYIMFFLSQLSYFTSAFSNYLPEGFTYSSYARSGFGELVAVTVINSVIMLLGHLLSKKQDGKKPLPVLILTVILSVFTLMLIAIAMSKMIMYMRVYGLTSSRLISSWFMLSLALIFIGVIVKQFFTNFRFVRSACIVSLVMFTLLAYSDVDRVVGETNVTLYRSGLLQTVDTDLFKYDLDCSSWKALKRLSDIGDPELNGKISDISEYKMSTYEIDDSGDSTLEKIFCQTLPETNARKFYKSHK